MPSDPDADTASEIRRVVVTGVTGLVGKRVARALTAAGTAVVGLSRTPASARRNVPELVAAYAWGGPDDAPEAAAFEGADAVVHLAGEPVAGRWSETKKRRIERSRVEGTARLVEAIAAASPRPRVLVSASAMGFYGDRGDEVVDESVGQGSDFLARVCVGWEREAERAAAHGLREVRLRIGLALDPEGGALGEMLPIFKAGIGGPLGSGDQYWSWIHVEDVVRIIVRAIGDASMSGAYNTVAPTAVQQREFAKVLGRVLRRPTFIPAPKFALRTLLGEFSVELLGSRRLVPRRLTEAGYEYAFPDLEAALRDLTSR